MRTWHFCLNSAEIKFKTCLCVLFKYKTVKIMIKRFFFFFFFYAICLLFIIRSGKFLFGLVKKICLPDLMSGKNLNTFANTDNTQEPK